MSDEVSEDFLKAKDKALISIGREPVSDVLTDNEIEKAKETGKEWNLEADVKEIREKVEVLVFQQNLIVKAFNTTSKELRDQFVRLERIIKEGQK